VTITFRQTSDRRIGWAVSLLAGVMILGLLLSGRRAVSARG
jgi:hypothetical protein